MAEFTMPLWPLLGHQWRGYEYQAFGPLVPQDAPSEAPIVRLASVTLVAHRQVIRRPGCPLWAEIEWTAEDGLRASIRGLEKPYSPNADLRPLERALRRLLALQQVRNRAGFFADPDTFLAVVGPAVHTLRRQKSRPTATRVREALGRPFSEMDPGQFTRLHQRLGFRTWKDVVTALS